MSTQRKIPFGYQIQRGSVVPHPREAEAVQRIFSRYLKGDSLQTIASTLTESGPQYHQNTPDWNKHMVKRILDNEKYAGHADYPPLISEEDYRAALQLKAAKNQYAPIPKHVRLIRQKVVCSCCGTPMDREWKRRGKGFWKCERPECGQILRIYDESLSGLVEKGLKHIIETPSILDYQSPEPVLSKDAVRLQSELNLALNRGTESIPYMRALIFAGAAERYASLPDPTPAYALARLKERLKQKDESEDVLWELFDNAVKAIRVIPGPSIEFVLINGRTYCTSNTTEEGKT